MKSIWTKLITASLITTTAWSAWGQTLEQQVQNKLRRLENITQSMEGDVHRMGPAELQALNQKLSTAIQALSAPTRPGTRPGPRPAPRPIPRPMPPRQQLITVSGSVENMAFLYDVVDSMDLAAQCTSQFQSQQNGNVDDASLSVNFSPEAKLHTSGWWTSAGETCGNIAQKAVAMGLPTKSGYGFTATGSIESQSFIFQGNSLKEILLQCQDFHSSNVNGNVDDIAIFNGTTFTKKHTSGWWTNANEVCNVIIQEIK